MPAKKGKKKASVRQTATSIAPAKGVTVFTGSAIVISLSPEAQKKAKQCLQRSGKITFAVRERSATKLHQVLDNGEKID